MSIDDEDLPAASNKLAGLLENGGFYQNPHFHPATGNIQHFGA